MTRLPFLLAVAFGVTAAAPAQTPAPPPGEPSIEISVGTESGPPGSGSGTVTVSGKVNLPPGWKLGIHTLTLRTKKSGTATTLNAFLPVKGAPYTFKFKLELPSGSYQVWGVIDVKDPQNKVKEVSSPAQGAVVQ
jgi:hypothetical protein